MRDTFAIAKFLVLSPTISRPAILEAASYEWSYTIHTASGASRNDLSWMFLEYISLVLHESARSVLTCGILDLTQHWTLRYWPTNVAMPARVVPDVNDSDISCFARCTLRWSSLVNLCKTPNTNSHHTSYNLHPHLNNMFAVLTHDFSVTDRTINRQTDKMPTAYVSALI